jgi:hypothetical protein
MSLRWILTSCVVAGVVGYALGFWRGWCTLYDLREMRRRAADGMKREDEEDEA